MKHSVRTAVGLSGVMLLLLLCPLPVKGRGPSAAMDLLHAPVFALFAAVVYWAVRERFAWGRASSGVLVWAAISVFGVATEFAQQFVGRGSTWTDAMANVLGAAAGVLLVEAVGAVHGRQGAGSEANPAGKRRKVFWGVAAIGLIALAEFRPLIVLADIAMQWLDMPMVASFEQQLELTRWNANECYMTRSDKFSTDGRWSLRIELLPGKYPGVQMDWTPRDWSRYEELLADVYLDDGPPLELIVKIHDLDHDRHDRVHDDRFHQLALLKPGLTQIRVSLADVARAPRTREMNLREISFLQFFAVDLERSRVLYLDNIRLQ